MGRMLDDVIGDLPEGRRAAVAARHAELRQEYSLQQVRTAAGKAQVDLATSLGIKQPSVSKIERQADMYLSTLRTYIEALGGKLDLVVRLPGQPELRLARLGELQDSVGRVPASRTERARVGKPDRKVRSKRTVAGA